MTVNPLHPATSATATRPLPRPTLLPGLRRLWRGRNSLQLGVDPTRAVVLELPDPKAARLLDLLDGSRSERRVLAEAARYRISQTDARALLDALCAAGLVVGAQTLLPHTFPAPVRHRLANEAAALALRGTDQPGTPAQILRRRASARVVVAGNGRLAAPVAVGLAQAGVGHVSPLPAGDRSAETELAETIAEAAPGTRTGPLRRRQATFVVQVGATGPAILTAAGYAQYRLAHLAMAVRDGTAIVGPLVPPAGSPCLNCIDLHRRDRDPDWPLIAAQLAAGPETDLEPCAAATILTAAGLAAGDILGWLDGSAPATLGASVEVAPSGQIRRRSWSPHPGCHCFRGARRRARA